MPSDISMSDAVRIVELVMEELHSRQIITETQFGTFSTPDRQEIAELVFEAIND